MNFQDRLFRLLSPREQRERDWLEQRRAQFRAASVGLVDRVIAQLRSEQIRRVYIFRETLPQHSRGWFDGLSHDDQCRVAGIGRKYNRDDFQKDRDDTDSHYGWPEN